MKPSARQTSEVDLHIAGLYYTLFDLGSLNSTASLLIRASIVTLERMRSDGLPSSWPVRSN
jgi:hypothetical protein